MFKQGFIPILLLIPVAIVILSATVYSSKVSHKKSPPTPSQTAKLSSSPRPLNALFSSPLSSLTPTLLPSSPNISPSPSPSPSSTIVSNVIFLTVPSPTPTPASQPTSPNLSTGSNYTVLTYSLNSTTVVTDSAYDDDCSSNCATKPLAQFVAENGGRAGMNGTYFCPPDYSWCSGKVNSTDFPIWNNRKKKWMSPSTLFWNGRGMMVFRSGSAQFFPNSASVGAPSDITGGIVNYPSLLAGGNLVLDEGSLPENFKTQGTRSGIGFGSGKLFLIVARSANMKDLAGIFVSLGATDALNLDGGGSSALYDGGYKIGPGRSLPNALIVK